MQTSDGATASPVDAPSGQAERNQVQTTLDGSQQTTTDTQTYHGKPVAPHKLYTELMEAKAKGKAGWWPKFRVALVPAEKKLPSRLQAMLQCIDCETYVSGTNPSEIARTHFKKVGEGSKVEYVCKVKGNINKPQPVKLVPGKGGVRWRGVRWLGPPTCLWVGAVLALNEMAWFSHAHLGACTRTCIAERTVGKHCVLTDVTFGAAVQPA
jgi:hypothetical protein